MIKRKYKAVNVTLWDHPGVNQWGGLASDLGWVYIVEFGDKFKIGLTQFPSSRIADIQMQEGGPFDDIHLITVDNTRHAERVLHRRFVEQHIEKEWFRLTQDQFEGLKTLKSYRDGEFLDIEY